jgi:photosystem II stability/assembly factor-like uncharacterized protein
MMDMYEDRVRRTLQDVAAATSTPVGLVDRLVAGAESDASTAPLVTEPARARRRRRVRRWLPLVAAAVVLVIAVALTWASSHRAKTQPAHPTPTPSAPVSPVRGPVPAGFSGVDVSFADATHGWALGTSPCTTTASHQCATVIRTTDAGHTWGLVATLLVGVYLTPSCTSKDNVAACVRALTFANDHVGYAWGLSSVYMTVDGGGTWRAQAGPTRELAIADGVAVRQETCPTVPCTAGISYQVAPVGSEGWRDLRVPNRNEGLTSELFAGGQAIYLLENPPGGTLDPKTGKFSPAPPGNVTVTTLFRLAEGTDTWQEVGRPLSLGGVEGLYAGRDDSVFLSRDKTNAPNSPTGVTISADGGRSFGPYHDYPSDPNLYSPPVVGITATRAIAFATERSSIRNSRPGIVLYLTIDGAQTWHPVLRDPGAALTVGTGFSSLSDGYRLSGDQHSVWLTRDGGQTWTRHPF